MLKYLLILFFITPVLQGTVVVDSKTVRCRPGSEEEKVLMEKIHALKINQDLAHSRLIRLCRGLNRYNKEVEGLREDQKQKEIEILKEEKGLLDEEGQPIEGVCGWLKIYDDMTTIYARNGEEIIIEDVKN
jgi:hypothetical protein